MRDTPTSSLRQIVREAAVHFDKLPREATEKAKTCLLDLIGCTYEAAHLPWSRQAVALARKTTPGTRILGTDLVVHPYDAAFANGVMGHGLVREDMHAGSICHHGVVIWPALLALAEGNAISGDRLLRSAVVAYEAGAKIGRALFNAELARLFRPTGLVSAIGAALGGGLMLGLSEEELISAMSLAANTSSGLNQWPHSGSGEMFFHPGFAARNAVTVVLLAKADAQASEDILEGEAGLFAAFKRASAPPISLFTGAPEILEVYNKPAPACNFAQTACQAAIAVAREAGAKPTDIEGVEVRVSHAAYNYPGCNFQGPFQRPLQAKMSIQYGVAAVLISGELAECNYARIDDPATQRLIDMMTLEIDEDFTKAFPQQQGSSVAIRLKGGRRVSRSLPDVVPATPDEVRTRVRAAMASLRGEKRADNVLALVASLEKLPNVDALISECGGKI